MKFLDFLKLNNQENDFMALASASYGEYKTDKDNIAWLVSTSQRKVLKSCKTTCSMKYDTEYVEFFSFILHTCLVYLHWIYERGPGHFRSVVSQRLTENHHYSGEYAKCNFAIPDVTTLRKFNSRVWKNNIK